MSGGGSDGRPDTTRGVSNPPSADGRSGSHRKGRCGCWSGKASAFLPNLGRAFSPRSRLRRRVAGRPATVRCVPRRHLAVCSRRCLATEQRHQDKAGNNRQHRRRRISEGPSDAGGCKPQHRGGVHNEKRREHESGQNESGSAHGTRKLAAGGNARKAGVLPPADRTGMLTTAGLAQHLTGGDRLRSPYGAATISTVPVMPKALCRKWVQVTG